MLQLQRLCFSPGGDKPGRFLFRIWVTVGKKTATTFSGTRCLEAAEQVWFLAVEELDFVVSHSLLMLATNILAELEDRAGSKGQ